MLQDGHMKAGTLAQLSLLGAKSSFLLFVLALGACTAEPRIPGTEVADQGGAADDSDDSDDEELAPANIYLRATGDDDDLPDGAVVVHTAQAAADAAIALNHSS